jgi:hypothetical protein
MADLHDEHHQSVVVNLVKDTVIADANPPSLSAGELLDAMRSRLIRQATDGSSDPVPLLLGDS